MKSVIKPWHKTKTKFFSGTWGLTTLFGIPATSHLTFCLIWCGSDPNSCGQVSHTTTQPFGFLLSLLGMISECWCIWCMKPILGLFLTIPKGGCTFQGVALWAISQSLWILSLEIYAGLEPFCCNSSYLSILGFTLNCHSLLTSVIYLDHRVNH